MPDSRYTLTDRLSASLENRIVLQACRPYPDEQALERLRTLARQEVDWSRVIKVAGEYKVLPLVSKNLQAAAQLPCDVREELKRRFTANTYHNLSRTAELIRVVGLLSEHGIPSMPFKGPVLAQMLYGDLSLRQFSDLDLLVSPEHFPQAVALMRSEGYTRRYPAHTLSPGQVRAMVRFFDVHHFGFVHPQTRTPFEVHSRLIQRSVYFQSPLLIGRTTRISLGGTSLNVLAPDALLFYLSVHGGKHGWHRLSWVCDIAAFVSRYNDLDWDRTWHLAARTGIARRLCLGLYLANSLLEAPLPARIQEEVDRRASVLEALASSCITLQKRPENTAVIVNLRSHARTLDRFRDKALYAASTLISPKNDDIRTAPLPPILFPLYYVYRPWRLVSSRAGRHTIRVRRLAQRARLISEAVVLLALASLGLKCLPFRWIAPVLGTRVGPADLSVRRGDAPPLDETADLVVRRIARVIPAAARALPWECKCLAQAAAGHVMLRRRGRRSMLFLGAARAGEDLNFHAWLVNGSIVVTGDGDLERYSVIAAFV